MRKLSATIAIAMLIATFGVVTPAQAAGGIVFYSAYWNSPGSDTGSNTSLNAEYVKLKNTSSTTRYITGWTLRDAQNHVYTFPSTKIAPGRYMTVRTGKGTNTSATRYWGRSWYVWNNTGDTAYLRTKAGTLKDKCSWGRSGSWKYC